MAKTPTIVDLQFQCEQKALAAGIDASTLQKLFQWGAQYGPVFYQAVMAFLDILNPPSPIVASKYTGLAAKVQAMKHDHDDCCKEMCELIDCIIRDQICALSDACKLKCCLCEN